MNKSTLWLFIKNSQQEILNQFLWNLPSLALLGSLVPAKCEATIIGVMYTLHSGFV